MECQTTKVNVESWEVHDAAEYGL